MPISKFLSHAWHQYLAKRALLKDCHQNSIDHLKYAHANTAPCSECSLIQAECLIAMNQPVAALGILEPYIKNGIRNAGLFNLAGCSLLAQDRLDEARTMFQQTVRLKARWHTPWMNMGICLQRSGQTESAEVAFKKAHTLAPRDESVLRNHATALREKGELERALSMFKQCLRIKPNEVYLLTMIAACHQDMGHIHIARQYYFKAMRTAEYSPDTCFSLGVHLLLCRRFIPGWTLYESRLSKAESPRREYPIPDAGRSKITGQRVLIYGEQGIGDQILFASCLSQAAADTEECMLECEPRLVKLFSRSFPKLPMYGFGDLPEHRVREFDCVLPIGSLPLRYAPDPRKSICTPYLHSDEHAVQQVRRLLARKPDVLHIGLAWRGGISKTRQQLRSLDIKILKPILDIQGINVHVLQHDIIPAERLWLEQTMPGRVWFWPEYMQNFDDLATLCTALDMVITVQCSVVHLCGALGLETWALIPAAPEWRYGISGERMPWYTQVRLIRQQRLLDWAPVIERVRHDLLARLNSDHSPVAPVSQSDL